MSQKNGLEIYVHIPFCVKKCDYCDFLSAPADKRLHNRYAGALLHEIQFYGAQFGRVPVSTIYIGGGTPSAVDAEYIALILKQIMVCFDVAADAEITIECNPGTLTEDKLLIYKDAGVNRLSIGLQSTFDDELKELGRIHTYKKFVENYDLARKCGFDNINIDLMSALPYQTTAKFMTTLKRVMQLRPEHISSYSLIIEKGTPFYERYKFDAVLRDAGKVPKILPSEDTEYEIYKNTQKLLTEHGYHHYEISNYAKPGYECRHNAGYWTRVPYLGVGLGASSLLDEIRYTNVSDIMQYIRLCDGIKCSKQETVKRNGDTVLIPAASLHADAQLIERHAQMEEFLFLGLRMTDGITRSAFREAFGTEIEAVYGTVLQNLAEEELVELKAGTIRLTDKGMDISNYVLAQFLLD